MPAFQFSAYDGAGNVVTGVVVATTTTEANAQIRGRGLLPFDTKETTKSSATPAAFASFGRLNVGHYAEFARRLSALIQADLPLDQCLRLMSAHDRKSASSELAGLLFKEVTAGKSLSSALEQVAPTAPALIAALVRAGEARGRISPALGDAARILENQAQITSKITGALVYPAILFVVALLTITLIVAVLVPSLMPLFRDNRLEPPGVLRAANAVYETVQQNWYASVIGAALSLLCLAWLFQLASLRRVVTALISRLPGIGVLVAETNTALLARTFGTLLQNGVPVIAALKLTEQVVTNWNFKSALSQTAVAVQEGRKLAAAIGETGVLGPQAMRFFVVGEEASKLDEMMLHLASLSEAEATRRIDRLLTLLSPALTLIIGGLVGGLILTVMQAILSVNDFAIN